jgi:site-specific DNA recombinase
MPHKIGAYIRVSTEEQAQVIDGSLESQQYRLKSFVESKNIQEKNWGMVVDSYIDDGFSAKDTRRPAYQRMLRDIRNGKIDLILVTDLSRLSRNISDFCGLLEELESHKAKFLSVKEQFDTSTPIGEMMIYNMINLAQFERKQTSERVSLNFHSRALRGLLNGGNAILGYDKDPENPGKLVVNEDEAPGARGVFSMYLETGSLQATADRLNDTSIRPKVGKGRKNRHAADGKWTMDSVRNLLANYAYVGQREVNKHLKNEPQETLKPWQRYQLVKASWPGIVEEKDFLAVRGLIQENWKRERSRLSNGERRFFLLSGVLRCSDCGRALIGQTSHGKHRPHRYYGHNAVLGEASKCNVKRLRAEEVEEAVVDHLSEILLRAGHLDRIEENLRQSSGVKNKDFMAERERVQKEIVGADGEIESAMRLMDKVAANPEVIDLIQEKLEKLATIKKRLVAEREELRSKLEGFTDAKEERNVIESSARDFQKGWPKASNAIKRRLVRRLLASLHYTREGLHAFYVTAQARLTVQPIPPKKMASEFSSEAISQNTLNLKKHPKHPAVNDMVSGVLRVVIGSGSRTRTGDPMINSHLLYQLS